jgi:hypothetical protein
VQKRAAANAETEARVAWRAQGLDVLKVELEMLRMRCKGMLEQGLSQSEHADVLFVFDNGNSAVSGHRGMLCAVSEEFRGMFRSGMAEERNGRITVPPGVSLPSFRGFLEFVYFGE